LTLVTKAGMTGKQMRTWFWRCLNTLRYTFLCTVLQMSCNSELNNIGGGGGGVKLGFGPSDQTK